MVIRLEHGADLHMAQLMPLPLIVSCFSKIQIGFTFLDSPGQRAVKRVCVCVFQTLDALKRASCGLSPVALKRTGCDVWQLECQASNVTASVQTDHVLR